MKMNKKKLIGIIIAAVLLLVLIGILAAAYVSKNENTAKGSGTSGTEYVLTDEESAALDEKISQAIDAYVTDFAKEGSFTEIMSEEDKKTLGKEILTELSGDLSEEETALLQEMIEKLFSENGGLTITGSASFSKEAKAEIAASIKSAVVDTLKASGTEGSDTYKVLQESVEKIVSEKIKESDVSYSLTSADISNIKQSVISSLGNINGKDGRDGRDGTDGKDGDDGEDGTDGKNGYTPVKGIDYFTSAEVTNITDSITKHLESYVDDKELAEAIGDQLIKDGSITVVNTHTPVKGKEYFTDEEIDAISTTIKNSIMDLVNQSEQEIRENIETGNDDISEMIGTAEKEENSNIYSNEKTYKSGDVIVQDGKIYICSEDLTEPEEFNEEHWKATDLVSINNYYSEYFSNALDAATSEYQAGIGEAKDEISQNKTDISQNKTDINQNKTDIDQNKSDINQNKTDINQNKSDIDTNKNDIGAAQTEIVNLQAGVAELKTEIYDKLSDMVSDTNEAFQKVADQFADTNKSIQNLEDSRVTFKLIDNGDGTYRLEITDPNAD